jgi:diacylglycerol kinase (CTP)
VFPRDIAALSIIYLSWTDPTASICGRLWGRFTPRCGNKSLAGSLGAWITGSLVTYFFFGTWQYAPSLATPLYPSSYDLNSHMSLNVLSLYGGFVAAFSEFIGDGLGLDDNLTIPVVSACMLWIPLIGFGLGH